MQSKSLSPPLPEASSGYSIVLVERLLGEAHALDLDAAWAHLPLGHPSRRGTAYRPEQRGTALLAGLAAGLKGIAPGNAWLRPNAALQARLGGRSPDQGTIHRWLDDATAGQAAAFRDHLHQVVHAPGRFWDVLHSPQLPVIDIDGQGLVARGSRFERAASATWAKGWTRATSATSVTRPTPRRSSTSSWLPATAP
jgi:hypothetical protein